MIKSTREYFITEKGIQNTNDYRDARKNILIEQFVREKDIDWEMLAHALTKISAVYTDASRIAAAYKLPTEKPPSKK